MRTLNWILVIAKCSTHLFCGQREYYGIRFWIVWPEIENFPHGIDSYVGVKTGSLFKIFTGHMMKFRRWRVPYTYHEKNNSKYPAPRKHSSRTIQSVNSLLFAYTALYSEVQCTDLPLAQTSRGFYCSQYVVCHLPGPCLGYFFPKATRPRKVSIFKASIWNKPIFRNLCKSSLS